MRQHQRDDDVHHRIERPEDEGDRRGVGEQSIPNSAICKSPESPPYDWNRDYGFDIKVVSGTGIFQHVGPGNSMFMGGEEYRRAELAQTAPTGRYLELAGVTTSF